MNAIEESMIRKYLCAKNIYTICLEEGVVSGIEFKNT